MHSDKGLGATLKLRWGLWGCGLLLFGINAYLLNVSLPQYEIRMADFSVLYVAGKIVLSGDWHHMYDLALQARMHVSLAYQMLPLPYNHAPYEALLFVPLAALRYGDAFCAWDGVNLLLLAWIAWRMGPRMEGLGRSWSLVFMLGLAYWPIVSVLLKGQDSLLLTALLIEAWVQMKEGREERAGVWLALGLFKFHLVLPMVVCLALARRWRAVRSFAAVGAGLVAVSMAMVGAHGVAQYIELLRALGREPLAAYTRPELMPNLRGLLATLPGIPVHLVMPLVAVASLLVLWLATRQRVGEARGADFDLYYAAALAASYAVSFNTYQHDMAIVFPALVLGLNAAPQAASVLWRVAIAVCALLLFAVPVTLQLLPHRELTLLCLPVVVLAAVLPLGRAREAGTAAADSC